MFFVVCLFLLCLYVVALAMGWAYPGNSVASYFMWRILSQPPLFSVSSSSMPSNRKRTATSAPVRQSSRRRRPSSALHLPGEPTDPALASTGDDSAKTGDVAASRMAQNVNAASPTTIPPALRFRGLWQPPLRPFQHHPRLPQSRPNLWHLHPPPLPLVLRQSMLQCRGLWHRLFRPFQLHRFRQLAPVDMHPFPTLVPLHLQPLNWQL